ncbi:hypothetical protein NPIL_119791 [Nephila pilipes]|uniref:Uncharacterized protein n=1 Tax=Nephila pilipes TaxID=299642 RepID=A0A8X6UCP0_NEPPI|nr:hypothetical protein NPIL_119791 [Nephila pilipes]
MISKKAAGAIIIEIKTKERLNITKPPVSITFLGPPVSCLVQEQSLPGQQPNASRKRLPCRPMNSPAFDGRRCFSRCHGNGCYLGSYSLFCCSPFISVGRLEDMVKYLLLFLVYFGENAVVFRF